MEPSVQQARPSCLLRSSVKARPASLPRQHKQHLMPGDLLFTRRSAVEANAHATVVMYGQRVHEMLTGAGRDGDDDVVHVALWTRESTTLPEGVMSCDAIEANNGPARCVPLRSGTHSIIRARDRNLAEAAVKIAKTWSSSNSVGYNHLKVARSVLGSSNYNKQGKRWAELFRKEAHVASPRWGKSGTFCSHLALAAYQAAALQRGMILPEGLQLNATYTTPRLLHGKLRTDTSAFSEVGDIRFEHNEMLDKDDELLPPGSVV